MLLLRVGQPSRCASPATERFTVSMTTPGTVDCGTFQDQFTDILDGAGTAYFDSAGNPIRMIIHWDHHSSDTNSVTGLTHERGRYSKRIDFLAETDIITGNQEIMNRPGTGVVVQDVGKVVTDADGSMVFRRTAGGFA